LVTYFQDAGGFGKGPSLGSKWYYLTYALKNQNKRVVVLFAKDKWGAKSTEGFYNFIPHSATLEMKDGKLKLRNSIVANEKILGALRQKNGDNVFWYPKEDRDLTLQDMEQMRDMKTFEAVENELNDKPELFSKYPPKNKRPRPWTAIRFYVANQSDDTNPCSAPDVDFDFNKVSFDIIVNGEYSYSFQGNQFIPAALNWTGNIEFDPSTNRCNGSWDEDRIDGHYKGNIEIYFNPFSKAITSYSATNNRINEYNEVYDYTIKCLDTELGITYDGDFREYKVFGTEVCGHIDSLKYTGGNEYTGFTLVDFTCQGDSYLNIHLYKEY
jgi:hypothetical protein